MDGGSADEEEPNAGNAGGDGGEGADDNRSGPDDDEEENPLPPDLQEEMREAFISMDVNGCGELTVDELQTVLRAMGQAPSDEETLDLMIEVDEDGSGAMDFGEFSELMAIKLKEYTPAEEIKKAFKSFDTSKKLKAGFKVPLSGKAEVEEFGAMFTGLGMTDEERDEVVRWARPSKEGLLDYNEFVQRLMNNLEEQDMFRGGSESRRF